MIPPSRYQQKRDDGTRLYWIAVKWLQGAKGAGRASCFNGPSTEPAKPAEEITHLHTVPAILPCNVHCCVLIYTCLMHARCQVPWRSAVSSPTLVRGAFKASGLGRSDGSAHGSRMKGATRLQTEPCHAAGTGWLSWSTQRVPTPSHRGAVAHAERVHRDRAGRGMAGHERVANEREHSTAKVTSHQRCGVLCGVPQYTGLRNSAPRARCPCRAGPQGPVRAKHGWS